MNSESDLLAILPAKSADKLARLLDQREAAREAAIAAAERHRDALEDFRWIGRHRVAADQRQGIEAAYATYFPDDTREIDPADRELAAAKARLDRARAAQEAASTASEKFAFLSRLTDWLRTWAGHGGELIYRDLPEVRLAKGETHQEAVARVRLQIDAVDDEWHRIESSPIPLDALKAEIEAQITKLAAPGQPRFLGRDTPGAPADIETAMRPRRVSPHEPLNLKEVLYHYAPDGRVVPHPTPFFFWMNRDAIVARLCEEAEKLDFTDAMNDTTRERAFGRLLDQRLDLAWREEAIIEAAAAQNTVIVRRSDCDPRAVLQIVESSRSGEVDGERPARRRAPAHTETGAER